MNGSAVFHGFSITVKQRPNNAMMENLKLSCKADHGPTYLVELKDTDETGKVWAAPETGVLIKQKAV